MINQKAIDRIFHSAPFILDMGVQLESVTAGECRSSLVLEKRHLQQDGYVHAGVQSTIADHTAGAAAASLIRSGQYVLTAEFKINLLRAAKGESLRCVATSLKAGASLSVVESDVFCITENKSVLVSKALVTLAVIHI